MADKRIRNQFILVHLVSSTSYFFAAVLLVAVLLGTIMNAEEVRIEREGGPILYLRLNEQKGVSNKTHKPALLMHRSLAIQI